MSDKADLDELAQRYLDLWQDQLSALAGDPAFSEALNRLIAAGGTAAPGSPAAAWAAWPAMLAGLVPPGLGAESRAGEGAQDGDRDAVRSNATAAGTAAAAAASGHGGPDVDDLARRLAELEKRVAALESDARKREIAAERTREGRA